MLDQVQENEGRINKVEQEIKTFKEEFDNQIDTQRAIELHTNETIANHTTQIQMFKDKGMSMIKDALF